MYTLNQTDLETIDGGIYNDGGCIPEPIGPIDSDPLPPIIVDPFPPIDWSLQA